MTHCIGSYQLPLPNGSNVCDGYQGSFKKKIGILNTQICQKKVTTQTVLPDRSVSYFDIATFVSLFVCACECVPLCACLCVSVCFCVYLCVCVYMCAYVCVCLYVCVYVHLVQSRGKVALARKYLSSKQHRSIEFRVLICLQGTRSGKVTSTRNKLKCTILHVHT